MLPADTVADRGYGGASALMDGQVRTGAYNTAIADLASQASPGIQPQPVTKHRSHQALVVTRNPS